MKRIQWNYREGLTPENTPIVVMSAYYTGVALLKGHDLYILDVLAIDGAEQWVLYKSLKDALVWRWALIETEE